MSTNSTTDKDSGAETGTLYERIGGAPAVAKLIDRFYARVLSDPELAPFFLNAPIERLLHMQKEFIGAALDGPQTYSGLSLAHAHAGRGISTAYFTRYVRHLLESLQAIGVSEKDINAVVSRIGMYADDVTGGGADSE